MQVVSNINLPDYIVFAIFVLGRNITYIEEVKVDLLQFFMLKDPLLVVIITFKHKMKMVLLFMQIVDALYYSGPLTLNILH